MEITIIFKDRTKEEPGTSGEQRFKGKARGGGRAASQRSVRTERGKKKGWKRGNGREMQADAWFQAAYRRVENL